jgi:succinate dehydrogenase / fumarate reductase cytochrome b subunit
MAMTASLGASTVGKKVVMAVSGVVLLGFVVVHLLGNLQLYLGPEAMNSYAESLRAIPALLWTARVVLILAFLAHVVSSVQLVMRNRAARPVKYAHKRRDVATSYAARTMIWTGPIVLLYVVYHVAHLTFGFTTGYEFDPANVYANVVNGFQIWWVSAIYIAANLALGVHLYHGAWSCLQSLGANHPSINQIKKKAAAAIAGVLVAGNLSFPITVMAGWVTTS